MSKKENKDLNIKELLKENEIKTLKDLYVLFEKNEKKLIESTLEIEFNSHMGYEKHN